MGPDQGPGLCRGSRLCALAQRSHRQGNERNLADQVEFLTCRMASSTFIHSAPQTGVRGFLRRIKLGEHFSLLITFAATVTILIIVGLLIYELASNSGEAFHK